jgi:hypothetical protein
MDAKIDQATKLRYLALTSTSLREGRRDSTVLFRLRCPASHVYLSLMRREAPRQIIHLCQTEPNEWEARVRIPPGSYRYRYYVDDGVTLRYYEPESDDDSSVEGLDYVLEVPDLSRSYEPTALTTRLPCAVPLIGAFTRRIQEELRC